MSKETLEHLNTNTLIGHTAHRGTAWHYRAEHQGDESNHYDGAIPVEDVQRRLFCWTADSRPIGVELPATFETMTHLNAEGNPARWETISDRQAITRSDTDHVMGIFTTGYERHQYDQWLLTSVANILDDDLSISSAGFLREGAIAWVEVSIPESIHTPEGVEFRPNLLATTSFDGSIATTYKRTITAVVCDNTRELALSESGQQVKVKHSRNSNLRLAEARDALQIVHSAADAFAAEVAELCATPVSMRQWAKFLDRLVPCTDDDGQPLVGRSLTQTSNKREAIDSLYWSDLRVAPWANTAYGVVQAVNTYEHHESVVRGKPRAERNMLRTISGDFGRLDTTTWRTLQPILEEAA
jgi:phage/plasmid-like protein (TIGR03299 family)